MNSSTIKLLLNWFKYRRKKITLRRGVNIAGSTFDGYNAIGVGSFFVGSSIGFASYIGSHCHFSKTKIGKYCSIGNGVKVVIGNHPTNDWVSTHPCFFSTEKQSGFTFVQKSLFEELSYADDGYYVTIGNDVWIGTGVSVISGVKIGDGAIIATGAVVSKDVPPYAIVGGVPAKIIRYRFSQDDIEYLNRLKWWDKPYEWVKLNAIHFNSINTLRKIIAI